MTIHLGLINSFVLGNANLIYTIIRKRQVFFALGNLSSDAQTISKLNNKTTPSKSNAESAENKSNVFKSNPEGNTAMNKEAMRLNANPMMTTLAETPRKRSILYEMSSIG